MNSPPNTRERMMELLCDRALTGLEPAEEHELHALIAAFRGPDAGILDSTAAAIALSQMPVGEAMPAHVAARALAAVGLAPMAPVAPPVMHGQAPARGYGPAFAPPAMPGHAPASGQAPGWAPPSGPGPGQHAGSSMLRQPGQVVPLTPRRGVGAWVPWLAAAACLALAVGAWWPRPRAALLQAHIEAPPAPSAPSGSVGAAGARQALLREAPDAVTVPWAATADAAAKSAKGDVVWSKAQQKGYMRFQGLAANDPKVAQYQLWIFDEAQDKRYPIDGGVFDVDVDPSTGDLVVAIDAKIAVQKPTLFAVTVERPGGVVVSRRERIVLTATPG